MVAQDCAVVYSGVGGLGGGLWGVLEGLWRGGRGALIFMVRKSWASSSTEGGFAGSSTVGGSSSRSVCSSSVGMERPLESLIGRFSSA